MISICNFIPTRLLIRRALQLHPPMIFVSGPSLHLCDLVVLSRKSSHYLLLSLLLRLPVRLLLLLLRNCCNCYCCAGRFQELQPGSQGQCPCSSDVDLHNSACCCIPVPAATGAAAGASLLCRSLLCRLCSRSLCTLYLVCCERAKRGPQVSFSFAPNTSSMVRHPIQVQ